MIMSCFLNTSGQYAIGHCKDGTQDEARGNRKVKFEAYYPVTAQAGSE
jgi:hypothetical protein